MTNKSNKIEAEAIKRRQKKREKRMKTLIENLGKALTDKNKLLLPAKKQTRTAWT